MTTLAQAAREVERARGLELLNVALDLGGKLRWLPVGARVQWAGGLARVAETGGLGRYVVLHPGGATLDVRRIRRVDQLPTAFQLDPLDLLQEPTWDGGWGR